MQLNKSGQRLHGILHAPDVMLATLRFGGNLPFQPGQQRLIDEVASRHVRLLFPKWMTSKSSSTHYRHARTLWLAKMAIVIQIKQLADMLQFGLSPYDTDFMLCLLRFLVVFLTRIFRSRRDLLLENLALRQQLVVMKQRYPRPQVSTSDKLFWVILRRLWPEWMHTLIFVQPET